MKKFILLIMLAFVVASCKQDKVKITPQKEVSVVLPGQGASALSEDGYKIVVIDSCEYIYAWFGAGNGGGSLTHKGNCKFCQKRHDKELNDKVLPFLTLQIKDLLKK